VVLGKRVGGVMTGEVKLEIDFYVWGVSEGSRGIGCSVGHLRWLHVVGKGLHICGQGSEVQVLVMALVDGQPRWGGGFG